MHNDHESAHQEDITVLNTNAPNNKASKYTKQKPLETEERKDGSTIIVRDFDTHSFFSITEKTGDKKISKDIGD